MSGELEEGESLGREPDLVERFGVSRPSLREALRILEAEGLISVIRGALGGVVVHVPDERLAAKTAALVMQTRNVTLADVYEARCIIEPAAVRLLATSPGRRSIIAELRALTEAQVAAMDDPQTLASLNAKFHERLVALSGNRTLSLVTEMLQEVVDVAIAAFREQAGTSESTARVRRAIRSQERLIELIEAGKGAEAEKHWRGHLDAVGRVILGDRPKTRVIDLWDHY